MNRLFYLLLLLPFAAQAQTPSWLRYPAISPDGQTIVFTYKGDLYKVAASGGQATALTLHDAQDMMPVWSPDGRQIAFASDRYGNFDVFIIPVQGGEPRRLTYHSNPEYPYCFTTDQQVLFGGVRQDLPSNRLFPAGYQPELYAVPVTGGRVNQWLSTPAEAAQLNAGGTLLLYVDRPSQENEWRKHHRSTAARNIYSYSPNTRTHQQLTSFAGEDRNPVFAPGDKAMYYLSEQSGNLNVYEQSLEGGNARALTTFERHPVRFLSASRNGVLCFSQNGDLYTLRKGGSPERLNISLQTDARSNREQWQRVSSGSGLTVSSNGKEIAFLHRGDVFVSSVDGGITRRITQSPETESSPVFSPDGKKMVYASERNGNWGIYQTTATRANEPFFYGTTLLTEKPLIVNEQNNTQPQFSPDGKELAFIENRHTLRVLHLTTGQIRTLLGPDQLFAFTENDQYFRWSPDGRWILFNYALPGSAPGEIGLVSHDGKRIENLTQSGFSDEDAQWALGGKAMIWQSNRDGLRAAANSGGGQSDVYALFFTQDAYDRFRLSKEDFSLMKDSEEALEKADTTKKKPAKDSLLIIEWAGLPQRKVRLTLHSSSLSDAVLSKDGETLYYLARFEKGLNLWQTSLRTRETKMVVPLNAGTGRLSWDREQKSLFVNSDGSFIKIDPASGKQDRISIGGEMMTDVLLERQQQLAHVARRTQATFYTRNFHGADWAGLVADYAKFLPHIGNNYEMAELLSELLGELNVSHSGAAYQQTAPNADATASLGILYDFGHTGPGIRVSEVLANGSLSKAGMNVVPGTIIESIDGQPLDHTMDWVSLLNRKAGRQVLLGLTYNNTGRDLVVRPITLSEESRLLYQRWVLRNEAEVLKMSDGKLGYVHIPGMNDGAYRTTYEEIMGKHVNRQAVVVDTRNNGGGDLVADLSTFLSGKKFMEYTTDTRSTGYEPNFRWTKPSISLANQANYSDGHCYAFAVKETGLGKLVGMPVPGTCSFAAWESLMDTGIRWGAPTVGCKDVRGNYLENAQTEPDIKVENKPLETASGQDEQLRMAVQELLKNR